MGRSNWEGSLGINSNHILGNHRCSIISVLLNWIIKKYEQKKGVRKEFKISAEAFKIEVRMKKAE